MLVLFERRGTGVREGFKIVRDSNGRERRGAGPKEEEGGKGVLV